MAVTTSNSMIASSKYSISCVNSCVIFRRNSARHLPLDDLPEIISVLHFELENAVFVTMSNDEAAATQAWKIPVAENAPNTFILEGGINNWNNNFGEEGLAKNSSAEAGKDQLCTNFDNALGDRYAASGLNAELHVLEYTSKVKMEMKSAPTSGGCG